MRFLIVCFWPLLVSRRRLHFGDELSYAWQSWSSPPHITSHYVEAPVADLPLSGSRCGTWAACDRLLDIFVSPILEPAPLFLEVTPQEFRVLAGDILDRHPDPSSLFAQWRSNVPESRRGVSRYGEPTVRVEVEGVRAYTLRSFRSLFRRRVESGISSIQELQHNLVDERCVVPDQAAVVSDQLYLFVTARDLRRLGRVFFPGRAGFLFRRWRLHVDPLQRWGHAGVPSVSVIVEGVQCPPLQ